VYYVLVRNRARPNLTLASQSQTNTIQAPYSYLKLGERQPDPRNFRVSEKDEISNIEGQENGVSFDTEYLGGLYRRKPKRHNKKKQSLNKNKYKKQRKLRN
jgi:hypothetical protein